MVRLIDNYNENENHSQEHLNEHMMLNEMATLIGRRDGFGLEIVIFSNDHMPAHMHVFEPATHRLIAKVLIPVSEPQSANDIIPYEGETLTNSQKKKILGALLSWDKQHRTPMWYVAQLLWDSLHPDNKI